MTSPKAAVSAAMAAQHDELDRSTNLIFSFAAAGWLQNYHFGVAKALQDSGIAAPDRVQNLDVGGPDGGPKFIGSSAGSLAASAIVVGSDFEALRDYACACAIDCRSQVLGAFKIRNYVHRGVELFATGAFKAATETLRANRLDAVKRRKATRKAAAVAAAAATDSADDNDALADGEDSSRAAVLESGYWSDDNESDDDKAELADVLPDGTVAPRRDLSLVLQRRLEVYATTLPFLRATCIREFTTVEDLDEALEASCLLVPLAGLPFRLRKTGEWVMDGGAAAFQPRQGEPNVITVSAMYFSNADIKPSVFIPVWWGPYPPADKPYRALFALGYTDCLDVLMERGLIPLETFSHLRHKYHHDTAAAALGRRSWFGLVWDLIAFGFFLFVLRPVGLVFVYLEMFAVLYLGAVVALLHDLLPRSGLPLLNLLLGNRTERRLIGTRRAAWKDVYRAVRNLLSMRVPLHILLGSKIPVNSRRLERYSRVYRALRPFLG